MELRQLRIFCTAAEVLSFTKAGERLGYAQSNITEQVRLLESELKVKFFERLGRGIILTNEGEKFYESAKNILALCEEVKHQFNPTEIAGVLNIGAAETICVYHLPKILTEYRKLWPKVDIRIQTDAYEFFIDKLKLNAIDIAIVLTDEVRSLDLKATPIMDEEMTFIASPNHELAKKEIVTFKDFEKNCLIVTLTGCGYRPILFSLLEKNNVIPGSLMELSSVASIKQCTIAGLGIAMLPKIVAQKDIHRGDLVELKVKNAELDVKIQLIHHKNKWISPAMKAFIDLCNKRLVKKRK